MRLIFHDCVESDLSEIHSFIARDDLVAADSVVDEIRETCVRLTDHAGMGILVRTGGSVDMRKKKVARYPNYVIYYHVEGDSLHVLYAVHAARLLSKLLEEDTRV